MKIRKRHLARLERAYSLAVISGLSKDGLPAFAAGSEGDGPLLVFRPPDYAPETLAETPGGFISLCALDWNGHASLVASCHFKPGFQGADCQIRVYPLDHASQPSRLGFTLPYTHRLATASIEGKEYLFASTLCSHKTSKEDWTSPGGIHIVELPAGDEARGTATCVLDGLRKNHGFDRARMRGRDGFLLSAMDGLFWLPLPHPGSSEAWRPVRIADDEHSDAWAFDWEGTGRPVVFAISPFHGNVVSAYRQCENQWIRHVIWEDLDFGHILWAGELLGSPSLLAGSRRSRQELRVYRGDALPAAGAPYETIDVGVGAAQIALLARDAHSALMVATAQAQDAVVLYELHL